MFHNETGYWMREAETALIMHSLHIPRCIGLITGGVHKGDTDRQGRVVVEVAAKDGDPDWGIVQTPHMRDNARTLEFSHRIAVGDNDLV